MSCGEVTRDALGPLFVLAFALALLMRVAAHIAAPPLTFDAWSIWSLAQSIPEHFYETPLVRAFGPPSSHSASFPLLWPALIALVAHVTQLDARAGLVAAALAFAFFAAQSEVLGRRAFGVRWIGLAASAVLLADHAFVDELASGGPVSMHFLLLASVGCMLLSEGKLGHRRAFAIGVLAGLAALNRFDALVFALASVVVTAIVARRAVGARPNTQSRTACVLLVRAGRPCGEHDASRCGLSRSPTDASTVLFLSGGPVVASNCMRFRRGLPLSLDSGRSERSSSRRRSDPRALMARRPLELAALPACTGDDALDCDTP